MATKNQAAAAAANPTHRSDALRKAFDEALAEYSDAIRQMHGGDFASARAVFQKIVEQRRDEPALVERARTYMRHCDRKLAPAGDAPSSADALFYQAVLRINNGDADEAVRLLDQALQLEPESARLLYARASASAIKGDADSAVTDLRRAIAGDPQVRFQAGNDPDFEKIREEPAFIDIIEPSPTGA